MIDRGRGRARHASRPARRMPSTEPRRAGRRGSSAVACGLPDVGGPGAVASFRTAARLWALPGIDSEDLLEITTPTRRRSRIPGVTVHDSFILDGWHVTRRSSIPVTSPARTLCDLTACWPPWQRREGGRRSVASQARDASPTQDRLPRSRAPRPASQHCHAGDPRSAAARLRPG